MKTHKMKNSGVKWIGMAPVEWDIKPIKYCIEHRQGGAWGEDEINEEQSGKENVICIRVADFDYQHFSVQTEKPYTLRSYDRLTINKLLLQNGDILVEKSGGGEKTPVGRAIIFDKPIKALYANFLERFRLASNIVPQYFQYTWNSFYKLGHTRLYIKQTTGIQNLDFAKILYNEYILVPSVTEQIAIANFLDAKCAEIDSLTADIERQIETLQEYKKSVITEAVTKGLDPNVEMKDSGVEWIGKVPMHWKTTRLKNEILNLDYLREPISAEKRKNEHGFYDYYGASGVIDKIDDYNVNDTVLLIGEDGANLLMRNLPLIYKASGKFWVNNHAHILKVPPKNDYEYFAFLLEAVDYTNFITGSAQPKLSQRNLDNVPLIIPNVEEQRHISEYLSERCADIELVVGEKQKQLEVLAQYKQSLIYEYVTGKKAVPT